MIQRLIFLLVVAASMLALIIYSQMRPEPAWVSGTVESEEIRVGSRLGGRIAEVLAEEGSRVGAGDLLIKFEPFDIEERVQQARALLNEREAALEKLETGMRPEEVAQAKARFQQAASNLDLVKEGPRKEEIAAAENRLVGAQAELRLAEAESQRVSKLFEQNAIPKAEFDIANQRFQSALSLVAVRENELKILQAGSRVEEIDIATAKAEEARLAWELARQGYRKEDIEQARAARDAAAAALGVVQKQKEELVVRAPSVGVIDSLDLEPGDLVGPNAPVLTMLSDERLRIRAYVPQRLMHVKNGERVRLTFDAFPDEDFFGIVTFISNQAEFTPGNVQTPDDRAKLVYRIRVELEPGQRPVRAGMTANVWLDKDPDTK